MISRVARHLLIVSQAILLCSFLATAQAWKSPTRADDVAYLFTSFRNNGEDGLYLAYSLDGYRWTDLGRAFLAPQVGKHKLMRDPSLVQGPHGTFYMVWTTGWRDDKGFGYASSKDLIHWSEQRFIEVMSHEPMTHNVWAPELFYDKAGKRFIVCWASTIPGRYPDHLEDSRNNHRMYSVTTSDFKTFTPTQLFCEPGFSVIDGVIVNDGKRYVLVHKDNSRPQLNLRVAFGDSPLGPWGPSSAAFSSKFTEGPSVLRVGDAWLIYFDMYRDKRYGGVKTDDFRTFTEVTPALSFPEGHKHGTALTVSRAVIDRLREVSPLRVEGYCAK